MMGPREVLSEIDRRVDVASSDDRTPEELAAAERCLFHPDRPVARGSGSQCRECQLVDFARAVSQVGMLDADMA
jgi:hypothetical protein